MYMYIYRLDIYITIYTYATTERMMATNLSEFRWEISFALNIIIL